MAIPSTGPLTFSAIQTEFGGSNPVSLSEYYAGGTNVPSGTSGTNGPVPTSGAIAMSQFYGTSDAPPDVITINSMLAEDTVGRVYVAGITLSSTGSWTFTGDNTTGTYAWINNTGNVGLYEVRCTVTAGALTTGTTGTWLNCGTSRSWTAEGTGESATCTFEIREASSGTVKDTQTGVIIRCL